MVLDAASYLPPEGLAILDSMATLSARNGERAAVWFRGLARALDQATVAAGAETEGRSGVDPDLDRAAAAESLVQAEVARDDRRHAMLRQSTSVVDAARRTGRSRQAIERLRRQGRALALRVGSQWRYPLFQLSADAPGGIVPGLERILPALGLSPVGAAWWLSRPHPELAGKTPADLLHAGQIDRVTALAESAGSVP